MLFDTIDNLPLYSSLHAGLVHVVSFLTATDLHGLKTGRIDLPDGIFAIVDEYVTRQAGEKFTECHRRYIDIQIVIQGVEQVGIAHRKDCTTSAAYDDEKDFEVVEGQLDLITLKEGMFALFFPHDAHMPGLTVHEAAGSSIKKIVFKLPAR